MFKVSLLDSNHRQTYSCTPSQTILEAARLQGVQIPYACKGGGCGMCRVLVEVGQFEQGLCSKEVLSDADRSINYTLACKTYPRSDMEVLIPRG